MWRLRLTSLVGMVIVGAFSSSAATSEPMRLDIGNSARRVSLPQKICMDCAWTDGATRQQVLINGSEVAETMDHMEYEWVPPRQGHYTFVLRNYKDDILLDEKYMAEFDVIGGDLSLATIEIGEVEFWFDGEEKTPHPVVAYEGEILIEGIDYVLSWENNLKPGIGKVVVSGIGSCYDTVEKTFTIIPAGKVSLDICSGTRVTDRAELLAYDETWIGVTSEDKFTRIMENGMRIAENTGVGVVEWRPATNGLYRLQYRTYADGYLEPEKYEATFRVVDPLVVSAVATPRYPWNGLVDIVFTISGDEDVPYTVQFESKDVAGGTNLLMQTVYREDGSSAATTSKVTSGSYHWVWNAEADLPDGFCGERIVLEVKAE